MLCENADSALKSTVKNTKPSAVYTHVLCCCVVEENACIYCILCHICVMSNKGGMHVFIFL